MWIDGWGVRDEGAVEVVFALVWHARRHRGAFAMGVSMGDKDVGLTE